MYLTKIYVYMYNFSFKGTEYLWDGEGGPSSFKAIKLKTLINKRQQKKFNSVFEIII